MCLSSSGRIYIAAHVNFNESSFPFQTDPEFMCTEPKQLVELTNTFSKFLTVSFPSKSHSHEATAAGVNPSDNQNLEITPPNDLSSDNNNEITCSLLNNASNAQSGTQNPSNYSVTSGNNHLQNQTPEMPQVTPQLKSSHPIITRAKAGTFKPKVFNTEKTLSLDTPSSVTEALNDHNWKLAMQDEFNALINNQTWCLFPPEQNMKLVGNKWIFRVKKNSDGSISRYNAKLVAKGYLQTKGVDYQETFSLVVKAATIRIVLNLAVVHDWKLRQVDINNAFLNGELIETVYMPQPEGAKSYTSVFFKQNGNDVVIVLIYVDDVIVTESNNIKIEQLVQDLSSTFALKDLGQLNFFLGIEVTRNENTLVLSQTKYLKELLAKFDLQNCNGTDTPLATTDKLSKFMGTKYSDLLSIEAPLEDFNMLYLPGQRLLMLKSESFDLIAYSNADWGSDPDDRRSTSGYCIYLSDNLVSWSSKKQSVVSKSSAESEYRAMALACAEITWICSVLKEINVKLSCTPLLLSDSTSAAAIATNPVLHSKTKHIEIDIHFVRDMVEKKEVEVAFVSSNDQIADVLTKPLTYPKFSFFRNKLKVSSRDLSLRRDVEILNEAELESSHVGVLAEAYLLTKDVTHTRNGLRITRDKPEDSSWQNSYTEIPLTLHD
ncbi:retrovirus-related pol polyprotein from transposon RE1 [Citrus sinensis]|nr:retrovirus-related pol polyprotein from transposon RE1 [Citrus sinensis]